MRLLAFTICLGLACASARAAPGAHGPNGEHLDEATTGTAGALVPRLEAKSELFELVARLQGGELSILVDRYATNEPVLGADLEVESGTHKAKAKFHADHGDYAVDDPAMLQLLASPGEHALVFTLVAGKESDLLDGKLVIAATTTTGSARSHDHEGASEHGHGRERAAWAGLVLLLGVTGFAVWRRQRRRGALAVTEGATP